MDNGCALSYKFDVGFIEDSMSTLTSTSEYEVAFQKVSGLGARVETESVHFGGDQGFVCNLPKKVVYSNLILSKGRIGFNSAVDNQKMDVFSLEKRIYQMFENFQFIPIDVIINSVNLFGVVISTWHLRNACPVSWSISDFDANSNSVLVDTLEFSYSELIMLDT